MKAAQLLVLWLFCALDNEVAVARDPLAHSGVEFGGKPYVRLVDWGKDRGFDARLLKGDDAMQLTNRSSRMVFHADARDAELNGITVSLSYPIVVRAGVPYISELDLTTAIEPVLFPARGAHEMVKNIVIDPGHGGSDSGYQIGSQKEKKYALLLAQEVRQQLVRAGFTASLTRTTDTFIDRAERPEIARHRGADLFISLHWNALPGNSQIKGAQVFCLTPVGASSSNAGGEIVNAGRHAGNHNDDRNMLLAYQLQRALVGNLGVEDRGVRRARFEILCEAEMPAVLIEGGFMSNPGEAQHIYDSAYRVRMARAIVAGVRAYKAQVQ
jgi:N-acetylmuramoyl-L-alanine amidase